MLFWIDPCTTYVGYLVNFITMIVRKLSIISSNRPVQYIIITALVFFFEATHL